MEKRSLCPKSNVTLGMCKESLWKPVHKQVKLESPRKEDSSTVSDALWVAADVEDVEKPSWCPRLGLQTLM